MTEPQARPRRRQTLLPTGRGLDLLVQWALEGPASLAPPANKFDGGRHNDQRQWSITLLRRLASSLGVDSPELGEQRRGHARDFGALSVGLLTELASKARSYGYVTAGCRSRVPLTPVQVNTLYRLTWGSTLVEIGQDTGCANPTGMAGALKRARTEHGCHTNGHLIACAYRNGWFPDHRELRSLLSGRMVWPDHGVPRSSPPYLWKDDS